MLDPCLAQQIGRRRVFWTTQPQACGGYFLCGAECQIPGLEYVGPPPPTTKLDDDKSGETTR
jgi:hypothetical protein